jgi:hypothetical protein
MLNDLRFDDKFKTLVLDSTKQCTSRMSTKLNVYDTFIYEDVDFIVTSIERKMINDVDYVSDSFNSSQELCDELNRIYFENETLRKRENLTRRLEVTDLVSEIKFMKVDVQKSTRSRYCDNYNVITKCNCHVQCYFEHEHVTQKLCDRCDRLYNRKSMCETYRDYCICSSCMNYKY